MLPSFARAAVFLAIFTHVKVANNFITFSLWHFFSFILEGYVSVRLKYLAMLRRHCALSTFRFVQWARILRFPKPG